MSEDLTSGRVAFSPVVCMDVRGETVAPRRMTLAQEMHLDSIKEAFVKMADEKYRAGQLEHGGSLYEMPPLELIKNIKQEAIDLWTYACTLEDQLIEAEMHRPHHGA